MCYVCGDVMKAQHTYKWINMRLLVANCMCISKHYSWYRDYMLDVSADFFAFQFVIQKI
jgi:hypothetical protein